MDLKLQADTRGEMTRCVICRQFFASIHWHHTVPRSLGGDDELQIPLCGSCHTALHAKAEAICARIRGKGKKLKQFWANVQDEDRADKWLRVLVSSILYPPVAADEKMVLLPSIKVDSQRRYAIEVIKRDHGLTSLAQALLLCIDYTAAKQGITNNGSKNPNGNKKRKLW